jgi:hypothetical protein
MQWGKSLKRAPYPNSTDNYKEWFFLISVREFLRGFLGALRASAVRTP